MPVVLCILGVALMAIAVIWRLSQIQQRAVEAAQHQPGKARKFSTAKTAARRKPVHSVTAAANTSTAQVAAERLRRTDRLLLKIPLQVSGSHLEGHAFTELTHTLVINRNGACILLKTPIARNSQLTIKNAQTGQTCQFRACQSGPELPNGLREWGVDCVEPAPTFWGISFPESTEQADKETVDALLECTNCHCRELSRLSLPDYRRLVRETFSASYCSWCGQQTIWKFGVVQDDLEELASASTANTPPGAGTEPEEEKRRDERRIAHLPIFLRHEDGRHERTTTENVSRNGACFAANMQLAVRDRILLRLISESGPGEAEFRAQVRWRLKINDNDRMLYGVKMERDS